MTTNTITSNDTLTLYDRVFVDLASGDTSMITFDTDLVSMKTGKNQNTIFARNESGNNAKMILRLIRGSSDDRFLQTKLTALEGDFASAQLAQGQFVKRLGDGEGNVINDAYNLFGGVFTRKMDGKENVDGDTEQGVAVYNMAFALAKRAIG